MIFTNIVLLSITPEIRSFDVVMGEIWQGLEERFGMFGLFIPLIVIVTAIILFYQIIIRTYGRYIRKKYNYRIFVNWPGLVIMLGYTLAFTVFGVLDNATTVVDLVVGLSFFGAPGTILYIINFKKKTGKTGLAFFTALLMLFLYMVLGYVLGFLLLLLLFAIAMALVAGVVMKGAFEKDRGSGGGWVCQNCGSQLSHGGSCPYC